MSETALPSILTFDSGLGGLTVFRHVRALRPRAQHIYAADDAGFPYGSWTPNALVERVLEVMDDLIGRYHPDLVVIACNTASTLVLPHLRERFATIPFVGTVPAVKPAATHSLSHLISVLATPATVARDYTHELIRSYARHCDVTLVGARDLAALAEAFMRGEAIDEARVRDEIAPCFVEKNGQRTDHIVLACTHYPLLLDMFERLAPWPVTWVDPAPAIARRADHVLSEKGFAAESGAPIAGTAVFTSGHAVDDVLAEALKRFGLV
jgi:glutamate racemase